MRPSSVQHAFVCDQVASAPAHMSFETQKTPGGHISLKTWPNQVFEVFFGIYRKCRCHKIPQTLGLDKF